MQPSQNVSLCAQAPEESSSQSDHSPPPKNVPYDRHALYYIATEPDHRPPRGTLQTSQFTSYAPLVSRQQKRFQEPPN